MDKNFFWFSTSAALDLSQNKIKFQNKKDEPHGGATFSSALQDSSNP